MNNPGDTAPPRAGWDAPAAPGPGQHFRWSAFLWSLVYPTTSQRVVPTVSGLVLIGLALAIGSAAYNAANNILFITLSLLLSCLILSGVMSWANLRGVSWLLQVPRPLRAHQEAPVTLELRNRKSLVPVYGLWFDLTTRPVAAGPRRPEATWRANSGQIRAAFAQLEKLTERVTLFQRERLDPGGEVRLDWMFTPARRGVVRVELTGVGSLFPFGFLRKRHGTALRHDAIVWPAPVEYRFTRAAAAPHSAEGARLARAGASNDLLALRRYQAGDSHRLIHWKASARLRQLMVRQFAAESTATYFLRIDTAPEIWRREEQFELMCGFAATLAEDLFTEARLAGAAIETGAAIAIRRLRDLEWFLDQLAVLEWKAADRGSEAGNNAGAGEGGPDSGGGFRAAQARRNVITFAPEAVRGVAAYVDGQKTATA
jgi:uncharacterized protein (DUF58 family)